MRTTAPARTRAEVDGVAGGKEVAVTSKARRRREVAERKSLKAKLQTLKKTKCAAARRVQRARSSPCPPWVPRRPRCIHFRTHVARAIAQRGHPPLRGIGALTGAAVARRMSVRKGVARGLQGATNQTHNQLSQDIMKLSQEHERLGGKGSSQKKKGKAGKGSKGSKAQSWEAAALQAIAEHADVEMAA